MNPSHLIYLIFLLELFLAGFWYTSSAVTQIFLLIATVIGCRAVMIRGTVLLHSMSGLMLAYLLWLFIVGFSSEVPYTSMMTLATLANLPIMYLVASNTPTFAQIWKYLRVAFFVIGIFFALWAVWQAFHDVSYGAVVGPLHDSNLFAALINVLWFPAAFLFLTSRARERRWQIILFGSGLFLLSVALFATASRGGIATWVLLLPFLLWAGYRNADSRHLVFFIPLIALLAYVFCVVVLQIDFLKRDFELSQDPSANARLLLWQSAIQMALAHPFAGSGWGTFTNYYPAYRSPMENASAGFFAHNDYLQVAAEGGLLAMLLLIGLLMAVLIKLKRSLRHIRSPDGLESVTLLLGVSALMIHASVNFIFYIAFMNILAGLYLARAAQLTDVPTVIVLGSIEKISLPLRRMVAGMILLIALIPLAPNLAAEFLNKQSNIKVANLVSPRMNAYQVAKFVTKLKPEAFVAQQIVLRTAELALADEQFLKKVDSSFQRELLHETLQRFESVRALTANNPNIGVRQAKMLIEHHAILDADAVNHVAAYEKAHEVLSANLKADPYHVDSIILLSRLYALEGRRLDAFQVLKQAEYRVLGQINQQLITVEILRQHAAPKVIPELAVIEKELHLLNSDAEMFVLSVLKGRFNEDVSARLSVISSQISESY